MDVSLVPRQELLSKATEIPSERISLSSGRVSSLVIKGPRAVEAKIRGVSWPCQRAETTRHLLIQELTYEQLYEPVVSGMQER